jgi:predicted site-specific integrase-resolvase
MKQPKIGLQAIDLAAEKTGRILKHMKIAIYNRVSTGKQDPLNQADQLREFRAAAATHTRVRPLRQKTPDLELSLV